MDLHQRLTAWSDLDCAVARQFAYRPVLLEVAGRLLAEQWRAAGISPAHDPLSLYAVSPFANFYAAWIRPLPQLLVERYCHHATLNLTDGEDFLTTLPINDQAWKIDIDLHAVEVLLNECGQVLVEVHQQALLDYWCTSDPQGQTPWQWFATHLHQEFSARIDLFDPALTLDRQAIRLARHVDARPDTGQPGAPSQPTAFKAHTLQVDESALGKIDADLGSALLIEPDGEPGATLLYTMLGSLLPFVSRQAFYDVMAPVWALLPAPELRHLHLERVEGNIFAAQALGLLLQQILVLQNASAAYQTPGGSLRLVLDVDRMTSMVDLCTFEEQSQRASLSANLPDWLRQADHDDMHAYGRLLIDVAQSYKDADGRSWLDGIDTAQTYAFTQLNQRLALDHPTEHVRAEDIQVINHQVNAGALPAAGGPVIDGDVTEVRFDLAQLAIANLGLLKPGRVVITQASGAALPAWMNETYVRQLVSELDIASAYPAMLKAKLLDDHTNRARRLQLLRDQLQHQLPALALELKLRGSGITAEGVEAVRAVFSNRAAQGNDPWVLRPLGFICEPGAPVDLPRNSWLIERNVPGQHLCLLYRPLHPDALLQFEDRLALLVEIRSAGALQDDLLERLPAETRKVYAHGGFLEPHLFYPLDDSFAVPFGTPAPVTLAKGAAISHPAEALYQACAEETIARFKAHAQSTAQARWERWKNLSWLLFNTLLPLAGSTLGKVAWLAQMEVSLAEVIEPAPASSAPQRQLAIVNLLSNIAMLLLSHAESGLLPETPAEPIVEPEPEPTIPSPGGTSVGPATPVIDIIDQGVNTVVDFSWANPGRVLSPELRTKLQALRASLPLASLGSPIPHGPTRGLYLHGNAVYVLLDEGLFRVAPDPDSGQMRIIASHDETLAGPWVRVDEADRWQLDLGLRLRGGMPNSERLTRLREQNQEALQALDKQLRDDWDYATTQRNYLNKVAALVTDTAPDAIRRNYLEKTQQFSAFWKAHLEHLHARNAKTPLKNFRLLCARALNERIHCEQTINRTLKALYQPRRAQLVHLAAAERAGQPLTAADSLIAKERLDVLAPLLDQLVINTEAMHESHEQLGRLASRGQPEVKSLYDSITNHWGNTTSVLVWRLLRMESAVNRLNLVHPLPDLAEYWLDQMWRNLELGIGQRLKVLKLTTLNDDEIRVRLLRNIEQQFTSAQRKLDNMRQHITDLDTLDTLKGLQDDLQAISRDIRDDLADYPQFPPSRSLEQLRSEVPGLIETEDDGLLLGEPQAANPDTVIIAGAEGQAGGRTYAQNDGKWLEVKPETTPPPTTALPSLKRLLKDGRSRLASARKTLQRLQIDTSTNYLPVEIEEILHRERDLLRAQSSALEARLTADNQTDETTQGQDAAVLGRQLDDLANTLDGQATELRIRAALRQRPRMGEVEFLQRLGRITVTRVGTRTQLAKVKGRPSDFIDEYAIEHNGRPLWYAHFHYPALDTPREAFIVAHLKTATQRHLRGQTAIDPLTGREVDVYRAPITVAAAALFLGQ